MTFQEKTDINDNIVQYLLCAKYNEEHTDEEKLEIEMLHDYIHKINFSDIDFTANITLINGTPAVTDEIAGDSVVKVSLGKITNREYVLDENLDISFSIDASRIKESELNDVLPTKSLVAQAKTAVFQKRIKDKIQDILDNIRSRDNTFEQENVIIL